MRIGMDGNPRLSWLVLLVIIPMLASAQSPRMHVLEQYSGTWCPNCPDGYVAAARLLEERFDVFVITVHTGDPMENYEYKRAVGLSSVPSGNVNRRHFALSPWKWRQAVLTDSEVPVQAAVTTDVEYDRTTRELRASVHARFSSAASDSFALGAIVVEDFVRGSGSGYEQRHDLAGNPQLGFFGNMPSPVPAEYMVYHHVGRALLGGYDGVREVIPFDVPEEGEYGKMFTYQVPQHMIPENIRVVGILLDSEGQIVNAGKSPYLDGALNARPIFVKVPKHSATLNEEYSSSVVVSDPDNGTIALTLEEAPPWLSLSQLNLGYAVLQGTPSELGASDVLLRITDRPLHVDKRLRITTTPYRDDEWRPVGNLHRMNLQAADLRLKSTPNGDLILLVLEAETGYIRVLKYGSDWECIGATRISEDGFSGADLAIGPQGDIYVAAWDTERTPPVGRVYVGDGTGWSELGSQSLSFRTPSAMTVTVDHQGMPLAAIADAQNGDRVKVLRWTGNVWETIPGIVNETISIRAASHLKIDVDGEGRLIVSWIEKEAGNVMRALLHEGEMWKPISYYFKDGPAVNTYHDILFSEKDGLLTVYCEDGSMRPELLETDNFEYWSDGGGWSPSLDSVAWICLANDDRILYTAFTNLRKEGGLTVTYLDKFHYYTTCDVLGADVSTAGRVSHLGIATAAGRPYVAYIDGENTGAVEVVSYGPDPLSAPREKEVPASLFFLFPNPAGNVLHLKNRVASTVSYTLRDLLGRIRLQGTCPGNGTVAADVSGLVPGYYWLVVDSGTKRSTMRVAIVR